MDIEIDRDHPAWLTILSTGVAWGVLLTIIAVIVFGIPFVFFHFL